MVILDTVVESTVRIRQSCQLVSTCIRSLDIVYAYDCRRILKHVSNRYNIFRLVAICHDGVVGLIYTTRLAVKWWHKLVACYSHKQKLYCLNQSNSEIDISFGSALLCVSQ